MKHMYLDADLFGDSRQHAAVHPSFVSSPAMKPTAITHKRGLVDMTEEWSKENIDWDMRSPENIELDELEGLLDDF
jgi:hypothetical protein